MRFKKICNGCGFPTDKCQCGKFKKMQPKKVIKKKDEKKESDKVLNSGRWQKKRNYIKLRDGYFCQRCWYKYHKLTTTNLQVHHIKSRVNNPDKIFNDDNLITLCQTCNLELGTSDKLDFEMKEKEHFIVL